MAVDINSPEVSKFSKPENTEIENIEDCSDTKIDAIFEVDEILAHRFDTEKLRFLVRWKGFGPEEGVFVI
jgi:hypothetical protein